MTRESVSGLLVVSSSSKQAREKLNERCVQDYLPGAVELPLSGAGATDRAFTTSGIVIYNISPKTAIHANALIL